MSRNTSSTFPSGANIVRDKPKRGGNIPQGDFEFTTRLLVDGREYPDLRISLRLPSVFSNAVLM